MVEALGIGLPHNAAIPAVDSRRYVLAHMAGRRIVEMVHEDLTHVEDPDHAGLRERDPRQRRHRRLDQCGDPSAGASPGGVGVDLDLDDWDRLGRDVPTIVDLMPSGRFLMEDFYYAGGLPAVMPAPGRGGPAASRTR